MIKHNHDQISNLHDYNINPESNEIFLFGEEEYVNDEQTEPGVEYIMANRFIRNLMYVQGKSKDPITVHMKSCGGMWEEGMAIFDAIKTCPNIVKIINYTHARSMSSIILCAADERVMHKHSTFMFHTGTMSFNGTVKQARTESTQLETTMKQMLDIYVDVMKTKGCMKNKTNAQIRKWLISEMDKKEEVYMSAEQAVEYGFADSII